MPRCDNETLLYDFSELHLDKIQYDAIMCSRSVHLVARSLSFRFILFHRPERSIVLQRWPRGLLTGGVTPGDHSHQFSNRTSTHPPRERFRMISCRRPFTSVATTSQHQTDRWIVGRRRVLFALSLRLSALSDTDRRAPIFLSPSNLLSSEEFDVSNPMRYATRYPIDIPIHNKRLSANLI